MMNVRLIRSFPQVMKSISRNVLFQWISLLASAAASLIMASMITAVCLKTEFNYGLGSILVVLMILVRAFCIRQSVKASTESSVLVKKEMRLSLFKKLEAIGEQYLQKWNTAEITQLATEGVEQLETYFAQYLPQFFYALLAPVTLFLILVWIDWKSALILLVCVPLIPASIIAVQKFAKKILNKYWGQYTGLSDSFLENLQGLTTLKIYQADEARHHEMNQEAEEFRKVTMRVLIMQLNSISVMDLVAYGGAALGIGTALASYMNGGLSLFGMLAVILLSAEFFLPMRTLGSYFHISMNGSAAADRMFAILDAEAEEKTASMPSSGLFIAADHVSFSYPDQGESESKKREVLKDLSFSLPEKGMVGIAGQSGSGKSTLVSLITGKYAPSSGSMRIGSREASDIAREDLLQAMTILPHDSVLFAGTIRDNLKMGRESATDAQMIAALEKTGIWKYLQDEKGLDTEVLENAANFSGGQKQRIAMARMLLADSPILILDEATSSADTLSEETMMKAVRKLRNDHLILVISHRLANLEDADEILMMEDGKLSEIGRHEDLMKRNGAYASLYNRQQALEAYAKGGDYDE